MWPETHFKSSWSLSSPSPSWFVLELLQEVCPVSLQLLFHPFYILEEVFVEEKWEFIEESVSIF